jgi:hypothetical protein
MCVCRWPVASFGSLATRRATGTILRILSSLVLLVYLSTFEFVGVYGWSGKWHRGTSEEAININFHREVRG